jgi:hypothetical protein
MALFTVVKVQGAAQAGANAASLVITAGATKPLRIHASDVSGMATSSSVLEMVLQRCTGTPTGGTSVTPSPVRSGGAASSFTAVRDATAGITPGVMLRNYGTNAFGGFNGPTPIPGFHWPVPVGESVCFRSLSGTGSCVINVSVEEVDD